MAPNNLQKIYKEDTCLILLENSQNLGVSELLELKAF